jgi:2-polyprenyl-6-methoxyphenol hydroxylase-like FAD-dependent oxidoreductase
MADMTNVDVLVVGAGPTGLTAACELARRGLRVRIIDEAAAPTKLSKACGVHARTLEIFDDMGIAEKAIEAGVKLVGVSVIAGGESVVSADLGELPTRYPFLLSISQVETEGVLFELLKSRELAVEREVKLVSFAQDGTGVTAKVSTKAGEQEIRAAWLIGCDGAHSTVRKKLEIKFEGSTYDERFLLADVKVDATLRDDRVTTYFGEDGVLACFPMKGGRFRLIGTAPPGDEKEIAPTLDEIASLFAARTGSAAPITEPQWLARFRVHCRQVEKYRDDRVFLAGDAAHIHSPVGGQGMNTGIQDAHNLAWKLALVHSGKARGLLLDSYELERHAVGQAILRGTDVATKVITLKNSLARSVRNEVARFMTSFELIQQRVAEHAAELTVSYERSPIVREDRTGMLQARIGTAAGGETPTLGAVRDFEAGPKPGARAPDGKVTLAGKSGAKRLLEIIDTKQHSLLLFDGRSASKEGYARFVTLAQQVTSRFPGLVGVYVITPKNQRPSELPEELTVLLDPDGELEGAYAGSTECAYLLRPDLYVGYRSQPADEAKLMSYLKSIFR